MKARHIKKLRKRIATFDTYCIRESAGAFGDFYGFNRLGLIMDDYYITADSYELALKRFFKKYEREFKRVHDHYCKTPIETTVQWGDIMVKNTKTGFIRYYRQS